VIHFLYHGLGAGITREPFCRDRHTPARASIWTRQAAITTRIASRNSGASSDSSGIVVIKRTGKQRSVTAFTAARRRAHDSPRDFPAQNVESPRGISKIPTRIWLSRMAAIARTTSSERNCRLTQPTKKGVATRWIIPSNTSRTPVACVSLGAQSASLELLLTVDTVSRCAPASTQPRPTPRATHPVLRNVGSALLHPPSRPPARPNRTPPASPLFSRPADA
jgi:hypothetical protein